MKKYIYLLIIIIIINTIGILELKEKKKQLIYTYK